MDGGRIHAVVISTTGGNVVYERFYERYTEQDKAELRAALAEVADTAIAQAPEQVDFATRHRDGFAVIRREGDLQYFSTGSGEYDELTLAEFLKALSVVLREVFKKQPSEAVLFDNYGRLCLVLDAMVYEGRLDRTDTEAVQRVLQ